MSDYIRPPDDYDFTQNGDYRILIENCKGFEDPDLLRIVKECHDSFDHTVDNIPYSIPIKSIVGKVYSISREVDDKDFNSVEKVIDFINKTAETNYFFIHSYRDLNLKYISLPTKYHVNGLKEQRREKLLNKIIYKDPKELDLDNLSFSSLKGYSDL